MTRPTFKELLSRMSDDLRKERNRLKNLHSYNAQMRMQGRLQGIQRCINIVEAMRQEFVREGVRA